MCVCVCACAWEGVLISVFAKWSKWEPTGSCALHFSPSSSTLPALSFSSSPEPRCAYVLGCFNFSAHNWAEPQGALIRWDKTVNMSLLSLFSLSEWESSLSLSLAYTQKTQYSELIKQINYQPEWLKGALLPPSISSDEQRNTNRSERRSRSLSDRKNK